MSYNFASFEIESSLLKENLTKLANDERVEFKNKSNRMLSLFNVNEYEDVKSFWLIVEALQTKKIIWKGNISFTIGTKTTYRPTEVTLIHGKQEWRHNSEMVIVEEYVKDITHLRFNNEVLILRFKFEKAGVVEVLDELFFQDEEGSRGYGRIEPNYSPGEMFIFKPHNGLPNFITSLNISFEENSLYALKFCT
ncbi:508_t:CDS:2 [Dentiscutata heterogama]|uniref:508_t:CDS:1 n=1 Tax=Dentiscutata heterogama TaxID=1316150 RepID=A0ACA9L1T7_9GLOM|nr:508_t:CDS:2 [Dentiscutata heterogama]